MPHRLLYLLLSLPLFAQAAGPVRPDPARGAALFEACAACHRADGGGEVSGTTPRIAGQHYTVLVRQLTEFRRGQRWDVRMEDVVKSHEIIPSPQDIADVASFISTLDRDGARGIGDGENVEQGEKLYAARCARCHGARGEGVAAKRIPKLAGQHAAYLSRQIYDAVDGRRPALGKTHRRWLEPLAFDEVRGLADYLSRAGWQAEAR